MAYYKIVSHAGAGKLLNVAASAAITSKTNVNIWDQGTFLDQTWSIASLGSSQLVKSLNNESYMLNATTTTWNCDVTTSNTDSPVNLLAVSVSSGIYRIQLKSDTTKYLTAEGTTSGSNVKWSALNSASTAQQWKLTTVTLPSIYARVGAGRQTLSAAHMAINMKYIFDKFRASGFTKNATCGILGNIEAESGSNPGVWQNLNRLTSGYGLAQFSPATDFLNWAVLKGHLTAATPEAVNALTNSNAKKLMDTELTYLLETCANNSIFYAPAAGGSMDHTGIRLTPAQFKASTLDAATLGKVFHDHYERSGDSASQVTARGTKAQSWFNKL